MLRLFQRDQSLISLFILLFIASTLFFIPPADESINTFPLLGQHIEIHWKLWFSKVAATTLILIIATFLVRLNVVYNFIRVRTYLPALFYILLVFPITRGHSLEPMIFGALGFMAILFTLFRSFKQKGVSYNYFYAGLFLGLISTLYGPFAFYIVFIYICLSLLRQANWREMIYPVLGMLIIYYLTWGIFYLYDISFDHFTEYFKNLFVDNDTKITLSTIEKVYLGVVGFLIVVASVHITSHFMGKKIYSRRIFLIFWWLFVLSLFLFFAVPQVKKEIIYLVAMPCSFLLTHYFSNVRPGILNQLLFIVFIVTAVVTLYV